MTAEWKAGTSGTWILETRPPRLLVVQKILFSPPALIDRIQVANRLLCASKSSSWGKVPGVALIQETPIAELSLGVEFFVTPQEYLLIYFQGIYVGEVEMMCRKPEAVVPDSDAHRQRLAEIAHAQVPKLVLPAGYRAVVIVTDETGDFIGVSGNCSPDYQGALIWSAAHGEDPKGHGAPP